MTRQEYAYVENIRKHGSAHVGQDEVEMPPGQQLRIAQQRFDPLADAVGGGILAAVLHGPAVDVDGRHSTGAAQERQDGQHAGAASHVESAASGNPQIERRRGHEPRGGVVSRAERHARHDDHLGHSPGRRRVERSADEQPPFDLDGREVALPEGIPVLGLDGDVAPFDAPAAEHRIDFGLAVGQPLARDVGLEQTGLGLEAFEGEVGQLGRQNLALLPVAAGYIQDDVVHNYVKFFVPLRTKLRIIFGNTPRQMAENTKKWEEEARRYRIYIRLENWGGATERPANPTVIAYAALENNQVVADYTQFDLKLEYYDKVTKPTHIVIVASSSRYGEDFCGGPGSVLYVDQFALSFEYTE